MLIRLMSCAAALMLLVLSAPAAAQYVNPDTCSMSDYSCGQARKERDDKQASDKADQQRIEQQSAQDAESYRQFMENQRKLQQRLSGDVERDRALLMKTPPIPPQKNALLGQWRLDRTKKKPANAIAEINAAISQPACEMVFGDGIWDFRPKALYGIDAGIGESKLTDIDYRGNEGIIGVIPKTGKLFIFKIIGPDRVQELTSTRIGADPCPFVRVGGGARGASSPTASQAANPPTSVAPPTSPTAVHTAAGAGVVVDGAAFRCADGSFLHVTMCQSGAAQATCMLTELHRPGLQIGKPVPRADIAARVKSCEAGGIRYGADDKPVFVR